MGFIMHRSFLELKYKMDHNTVDGNSFDIIYELSPNKIRF